MSTSCLRCLFDAIYASVNVVRDLRHASMCMYLIAIARKTYNKNASAGNSTVNAQSGGDRPYKRIGPRSNRYNKTSKRRYYECQMVGHIASECWNMNSQKGLGNMDNSGGGAIIVSNRF